MTYAKSIKIECRACAGAGIYPGFGDMDETGCVCHKCGGTGEYEFHFNDFTGRKKLDGIRRVIPATHYNEDCSLGYEEWLRGIPFPI